MSRGLPYQISLKKLRLSGTPDKWDRYSMSRGLPYQISLKKLRLSGTPDKWDHIFMSLRQNSPISEKFEDFSIFERLKYSNDLKI